MERELGGVKLHFVEAEPVPIVKLFAKNGTKVAVVVSSLKERRSVGDVLFADDAPQGCDGADGAQLGHLVVDGKRNLLDSLAILDSLGVLQGDQDSLHTLKVDVVDVSPADQPTRVDVVVRCRQEG